MPIQVIIDSIGTPTRPLVYLDHWALCDFSAEPALGDRLRRILSRGTLTLSMLNLLETARTKGSTPDRIASFLDAVGSHWTPIALSSGYVEQREDAQVEFPWRDEKNMPVLLRAPRVAWKPGSLVRRLQEPWAAEKVNEWETQQIEGLAAYFEDARSCYLAGKLELDRTTDVPVRLDTRAIFATVTQRFVRRSLKIERHNIEDFMHTCVPVANCDVVFLDGKTKDQLLERMDTPARVFSRPEVEQALTYLETKWPPAGPEAPV